jgi:DNA-directed RNA polymerase
MDWRGRLYAVPVDLNPQGEDAVRALLTFSEGKALDERGAFWLAVHGANSFGEDKVSFEDRVEWVRTNEDAILKSAADPHHETWWRGADAPWQFLAFCFEWAAFKQHGIGYVSHLPVSLDGTCNGLQHFSAMLRDEQGGSAVNLMPSDTPHDIYAKVAERVVQTLSEDADPLAEKWLGIGVDRKLVKLAVMTLPYGAGDYTRGDQIKEYLEDLRPKAIRTSPRERNYLVKKHVTPAIEAMVPSARKAMQWLQEVALAMAAKDLPVQWQTPTGFVVQQSYHKQDSVLVKYRGKKIQHRMPTEKFTVDAKDNRLGPRWTPKTGQSWTPENRPVR